MVVCAYTLHAYIAITKQMNILPMAFSIYQISICTSSTAPEKEEIYYHVI